MYSDSTAWIRNAIQTVIFEKSRARNFTVLKRNFILNSHFENFPRPENSDLKRFFEALNAARQYGLHYEFMEFFLLDYKHNGDILEAISYANREWDLWNLKKKTLILRSTRSRRCSKSRGWFLEISLIMLRLERRFPSWKNNWCILNLFGEFREELAV